MRTRAMASLRRPRPLAWPVITWRPAVRGAAASMDSVVYSDGAFSASKPSATGSSVKYVASSAGVSTPVGSATMLSSSRFLAALLGDLVDLVRLRLLRLVRVRRPRVDLELAERLTAERVLGDHSLDRLLDRLLGVLGHQVPVGDRVKATRVARVPVRALVLQLVAGECHLVRVDDDDEVTGVDVRSEDGLVLAPQQHRHMAGQAAEHYVSGVDDMPLTCDVTVL